MMFGNVSDIYHFIYGWNTEPHTYIPLQLFLMEGHENMKSLHSPFKGLT